MIAEHDRQIENLRRVLDITRQMAVTFDLTQLLSMIVDATCQVLDCERATIFLYDRATRELTSRVATGGESIRFPSDRGIAGAAAQQRAIVNVPDAYADERFNPEIDKQTGFHTRSLLTFPLENLDGELMGVLQALNKSDGAFSAGDEELARVLSAQAGVALHRYFLLEEYAEKQRMAHDLELARDIQQALFPKRGPTIPGYEVAGWNCSADETGGDCYDFIPLDDGRHAFLLADATGHGIGAALVIAQCRSLVRAMLSVTKDLSALTARVNQILCHDLMDDRFVTAFVGVLDPQRHRLEYLAAGQGPLLFASTAGVETRSASGLPLAILEDLTLEVEHFDFAPGATAVLLTDGFYEAADQCGAQFGEERVIGFLRENSRLPLDSLIQRLHAEICQFCRQRAQADDLTAILIRRGG
jgi:sigma-B regulation protein RsbU (phosphoserine phosphatase)